MTKSTLLGPGGGPPKEQASDLVLCHEDMKDMDMGVKLSQDWGLGFEFCVFVAGWRHALRSEWPFIIIIIGLVQPCLF